MNEFSTIPILHWLDYILQNIMYIWTEYSMSYKWIFLVISWDSEHSLPYGHITENYNYLPNNPHHIIESYISISKMETKKPCCFILSTSLGRLKHSEVFTFTVEALLHQSIHKPSAFRTPRKLRECVFHQVMVFSCVLKGCKQTGETRSFHWISSFVEEVFTTSVVLILDSPFCLSSI